MHLRWFCTENNFQCKNIVSGTYNCLAPNKKEQKIITCTYDIYFPFIYLAKYTAILLFTSTNLSHYSMIEVLT